jgi:hypothetical protein
METINALNARSYKGEETEEEKARRLETQPPLPKTFKGDLLNDKDRNYDVVLGDIQDEMHWQVLQPLQIAKIYIDFRELPPLMKYNEHFSIIITNDNDEEYELPYYFSPTNDGNVNEEPITAKNKLLVIRVFNCQPNERVFKVGIRLYHGLFIPYL